MPYDPDEHGRLDATYIKHALHLQHQVRVARGEQAAVFGFDPELATSVTEDHKIAMEAAHALYLYLLEHEVDE